MVIGSVFLLAAMVSPEIRPSSPAPHHIAAFQPSSRATARATASVRIVSGVHFGHGKGRGAIGAMRRKIQLAERDDSISQIELLEFQ